MTSARVRWVDRLATATITVGGVSVILAVLGILAYLIAVVLPLFSGASLQVEASYSLPSRGDSSPILFAEIDEYRLLGIALRASGAAITFGARSGVTVGAETLFAADVPVTAFSRGETGGEVALGFADGTIRLGRIALEAGFVPMQATNGPPVADDPGPWISGGGVEERIGADTARRVTLSASIEEPFLPGDPGRPIEAIHYRPRGSEARLVAYQGGGRLLAVHLTSSRNLITGAVSRGATARDVPLPAAVESLGPPAFLLITSLGDQVYAGWRDGTLLRYDMRGTDTPLLAESLDLTPGESVSLTSLRFMTGEQSLLASDSSGSTTAWFRVERPAGGDDGYALLPAHVLGAAHDAPVSAVAVSSRDKTLATAADDGSVMLHHLTSERRLASTRTKEASPVVALQITPKGDAVFALGRDDGVTVWSLRNPHPETTLGSLFGSVWYEGYTSPSFTWQSSSGTDDFEPKLSLVPLLFGTLKATLYSMFFAVPIALFAAIHTSEFLDPRYRAPLKSTIEMMASLPSVVLGFVAALVLAPIVESWVLAVLLAFSVGPLAALAAGYAWQIAPRRVTAPLAGGPQLVILLIVVLGSIAGTRWLAAPLEQLLFRGDFTAWLDGRVGTGAPGLGMIVWPAAVVGLLVVDRRYLAPAIHLRTGSIRRRGAAVIDFVKYLLIIAVSVVVAWIIAVAGEAMGIDPRGALVGTYVQRNALIVGFVMGFAVIPIIYTIAEDALSAVPRALRSASLGCGATPWQTVTRVILPVAIPGIFSALMVGLGRAVGETMIVLMAAGNTPLMDLNLFNGLRTLSANIAVELPEAVKDGTLYRVLFLSALLLFSITFVVNTIAEIIRQRFRRRTYQL